jgi:hypothetical protein
MEHSWTGRSGVGLQVGYCCVTAIFLVFWLFIVFVYAVPPREFADRPWLAVPLLIVLLAVIAAAVVWVWRQVQSFAPWVVTIRDDGLHLVHRRDDDVMPWSQIVVVERVRRGAGGGFGLAVHPTREFFGDATPPAPARLKRRWTIPDVCFTTGQMKEVMAELAQHVSQAGGKLVGF